jgi:hypothetical protein
MSKVGEHAREEQEFNSNNDPDPTEEEMDFEIEEPTDAQLAEIESRIWDLRAR